MQLKKSRKSQSALTQHVLVLAAIVAGFIILIILILQLLSRFGI